MAGTGRSGLSNSQVEGYFPTLWALALDAGIALHVDYDISTDTILVKAGGASVRISEPMRFINKSPATERQTSHNVWRQLNNACGYHGGQSEYMDRFQRAYAAGVTGTYTPPGISEPRELMMPRHGVLAGLTEAFPPKQPGTNIEKMVESTVRRGRELLRAISRP